MCFNKPLPAIAFFLLLGELPLRGENPDSGQSPPNIIIEITQTDTGTPQTLGNYTWTATFDPRGHRILTDHRVAGDLADRTIKTWYDPQVEFLPVVIALKRREWRPVFGTVTGPSCGGV